MTSAPVLLMGHSAAPTQAGQEQVQAAVTARGQDQEPRLRGGRAQATAVGERGYQEIGDHDSGFAGQRTSDGDTELVLKVVNDSQPQHGVVSGNQTQPEIDLDIKKISAKKPKLSKGLGSSKVDPHRDLPQGQANPSDSTTLRGEAEQNKHLTKLKKEKVNSVMGILKGLPGGLTRIKDNLVVWCTTRVGSKMRLAKNLASMQ